MDVLYEPIFANRVRQHMISLSREHGTREEQQAASRQLAQSVHTGDSSYDRSRGRIQSLQTDQNAKIWIEKEMRREPELMPVTLDRKGKTVNRTET